MPISISPEIVVNSNTAGDQTGPFVGMLGDGSFMFSWTVRSAIDGLSRVVYRAFDKELVSTSGDSYLQTGSVGIDNNIAAGVIGFDVDHPRDKAAILFKATSLESPPVVAVPGATNYVLVGGPYPTGVDYLIEGGLLGANRSWPYGAGLPYVIDTGGVDGFDIAYTPMNIFSFGTQVFPVNTTTEGNQIEPSIANSATDALVAWTSYSSLSDAEPEIRGRVLSGGNDFLIAGAAGHALTHCTVEILSNKSFAVAWLVDEEKAETGIHLKFVNQTGSTIGIERTVTADNTDDYSRPSLISLNDGRVLAVYVAKDSTSGDYEIRGRLFEETGLRVGAEFLIGSAGDNQNVTFDLTRGYSPSDLLGDGPFTRNGKVIVTWDKNSGSESGIDIVATAIDPGTYTGTELADSWIGGRFSDRIYGRDGADTLFGRNGNDYVSGGSGSDTLYGGIGADRLKGGSGVDKFCFTSKIEGGDTITDFGANDFFVFKGTSFGNIHAGKIDASTFRTRTNDTKALDSNDHFIFRQSDDTLWFDLNGSASGGLYKIADFANDFNLKAIDILII
jgi:Ca2+-binding RTX toxin-like protein